MLGRSAPGIRRADRPRQVTDDVKRLAHVFME